MIINKLLSSNFAFLNIFVLVNLLTVVLSLFIFLKSIKCNQTGKTITSAILFGLNLLMFIANFLYFIEDLFGKLSGGEGDIYILLGPLFIILSIITFIIYFSFSIDLKINYNPSKDNYIMESLKNTKIVFRILIFVILLLIGIFIYTSFNGKYYDVNENATYDNLVKMDCYYYDESDTKTTLQVYDTLSEGQKVYCDLNYLSDNIPIYGLEFNLNLKNLRLENAEGYDIDNSILSEDKYYFYYYLDDSSNDVKLGSFEFMVENETDYEMEFNENYNIGYDLNNIKLYYGISTLEHEEIKEIFYSDFPRSIIVVKDENNEEYISNTESVLPEDTTYKVIFKYVCNSATCEIYKNAYDYDYGYILINDDGIKLINYKSTNVEDINFDFEQFNPKLITIVADETNIYGYLIEKQTEYNEEYYYVDNDGNVILHKEGTDINWYYDFENKLLNIDGTEYLLDGKTLYNQTEEE